MEFNYYPGCSLEEGSGSYDISSRACASHLGLGLKDLENWNCCGATASSSVNHFVTQTLAARNLAIGEKSGLDIVAPCSACFKNLQVTNDYLKENPEVLEKINIALAEDKLQYHATINVRHLLEVMVNEIGLDKIKTKVSNPLTGLKVATYYGCQMVRPENPYVDAEDPTLFEELIETLGATPVNYPLRLKCCGASLVVTKNDIALKLINNLLKCAKDNGADCIVTNCPMCQLNLDAYQRQVNAEYNTNYNIPILYFTQLMGVAFKLTANQLGLGKEFVSANPVLEKYL